MEDNQTTVTMSLKRYKELESYEIAFNELKKDTGRFLWHDSSYGEYLVELSNEPNAKLLRDLRSAIELRDAIINKRK